MPAPRPFLHLNFAVDRDGRLAGSDGASLEISSAEDWRRVHALRERYQAVAVGGRTWNQDRPRLDARSELLGHEPSRQPDRVIFCGGQPCVVSPDGRRSFAVGSQAPRVSDLAFVFAADHDLRDPLATLCRHGVGSMLVEGGATLLTSFLCQGLYDRVTVFVASGSAEGAERAARRAMPDLPPMAIREEARGFLLRWPLADAERDLAAEPDRAVSLAAGKGGLCRGGAAVLPTSHGDFSIWVYEAGPDIHHVALVLGEVAGNGPVMVRVHSECLTGDVLGSLRCDCGPQLAQALERIGSEGRGVLLYLRQEGRGIGLFDKVRAYALQDLGLDTVEANEHLGLPADLRDYSFGARILANLGVGEVRLLTNNPHKVEAFGRAGLRVVERVPLVVDPTKLNEGYLRTKSMKLGHFLG